MTKLKKIIAIVLLCCIIVGLNVLPKKTMTAHASDSEEPSLMYYASKQELMTAFTPKSDGTADNIAMLKYGNKSVGPWYILGKDSGISGDNIVLFEFEPYTRVCFKGSSQPISYDSSYGEYETNPELLNPNHYGASSVRYTLHQIIDGIPTRLFSEREIELMQITAVKEKDIKNESYYIMRDKLYIPTVAGTRGIICIGQNNDIFMSRSTYWGDVTLYDFWLRSVYPSSYDDVQVCGHNSEDYVLGVCERDINLMAGVRFATNIDISSVLFASAAESSQNTSAATVIPDNTAMTLRFDGRDMDIGSAECNVESGRIVVKKGSHTGSTALIVQGRG